LTKTSPVHENTVASDALQAFINMASVDTRLYIDFITGIISNGQQTSTTTLLAAITSFYPLIHHHAECLAPHLVTVVGLLLKVLDPHFPSIRDACMPASTNILRYMVEVYPMITFHHDRQKLAVGTTDGYVVIFDMRTASKSQVFESHKSPIAACAFSPAGDMICTFAPRECLCKLWSIESGVLNLLGVGSRAIKTFEVPNSKSTMKITEILKNVKIEWNGSRSFTLKPGKNLNKQTFTV
jgi:WD40 repeat protein